MTKVYQVAPGVTEINGAPVPKSRRVSLSDAEALYELAHGRLTPAPVRKRVQKARKAPADGRD